MRPELLHAWKDGFARKVAFSLASEGAEHATDLLGLAGMTIASADKLRSALKKPDDPNSSVMGGETGRTGTDLASLALMAAPSAAALHQLRKGAPGAGLAGGGSKGINALNLASLAALMAPGADKLQARLRGGDDKRLLSDRAHEALEVGGLGGLSAGVLHGMHQDRSLSSLAKGGTLLAGYGTLAAPAVHGLVHPHHAEEGEEGAANPDSGKWKKPLSEIAGLSLLAAPSLVSLARGHHAPAPVKLAADDTARLQRTISKLEKLEQDPPEPKQLGRYAMLGAAVAPVTSLLGDVIEGETPWKVDAAGRPDWKRTARRLAGKSIAGAVTSGFIPIIRHRMDRQAEIGELRDQIQRLTPPAAHPDPAKLATALIPNASSGSAKARLAASRRIGRPRMTNLEGPSVAQVSRTMGPIQPGAAKGTI